jgi:hypothetical protein
MPNDNADGGVRPDQAESSSSRCGHRSRRGNGSRQQASKFEGSCDDLKGAVYDVTSAKESFLTTTRKIAEYVSRQYDDAGEFRTGMIDLVLPTLTMPADPATLDFVQVELWKIQLRTHTSKVVARRRNEHRIFALTLGQCSQAVRNRIEAHQDWATIDANTDVIQLLRVIQLCMTQRQTRKNEVHALYDSVAIIFSYK